MAKIRKSLLFVCVGLLAGCASQQVSSVKQNQVTVQQKFPIYISLASGNFKDENKQFQQALAKAFSPYTAKILVGKNPLSKNSAAVLARRMSKGYVVYPVVIKWENHNTPWSTIRDKASVSILLVEAGSGRIIDKTILEGKSSIWTLKNNTPQVILPKLAERYVQSLYK